MRTKSERWRIDNRTADADIAAMTSVARPRPGNLPAKLIFGS
jgi:hypothetical protein